MSNEDTKHTLSRRTSPKRMVARCFKAPLPTPYDQIMALETCVRASIEVTLLYEQTERLGFALDASFKQNDLVIDQRVLLKHGATGENLLYAASLLLLDVLPQQLAPQLHTEHALPISRLLQGVAPKQTIVACELQSAGKLESEYFGLDFDAPCLARTILYALDSPVLLVYEIIPL